MTGLDPDTFRRALPAEGRMVLCTHRHPDPDGLGGLVGLQYLLRERLGLESDLVLEGQIRRAENTTMRRLLKIEALPKGAVDPEKYAGVLIVDSQPGFTHTHPPGGLPILGVIDHHEGPAETEDERKKVPFIWVDPHTGSTSTMVYELLRAFDLTPDQRTATALFCGVRYDTADLSRGATPNDEKAYRELQLLADRVLVREIDKPPLKRDYFRQMGQAIESCEVYGPVLLTLMGEVSSPEAVAEVADWFVRLQGQQWSLAGGGCDGRYQLSVRTDIPGADAYPALRAIVGEEGSCGGHGRMAGGQIPLTELSLEEVMNLVKNRALEVFGVSDLVGEPLASRSEKTQTA